MTVKDFWNSKELLAIHCDTRDKARQLLIRFYELGKTWISGESYLESEDSYLEKDYYEVWGSLTCYLNNGTFCDTDYVQNNCIQIIEFDYLEDFKKKINITLKEIFMKKRREIVAIHCTTNEQAKKVCAKFKEFGFVWADGDEIDVEKTYWDGFFSCYIVNNFDVSLNSYGRVKECMYKIIEFAEIDDFNSFKRPEILTDKEFTYILNIIKPFINKIIGIGKRRGFNYTTKENIVIYLNNGEGCLYIEQIYLPSFKIDTMYKGMKPDRTYTLEELGFIKSKKEQD